MPTKIFVTVTNTIPCVKHVSARFTFGLAQNFLCIGPKEIVKLFFEKLLTNRFYCCASVVFSSLSFSVSGVGSVVVAVVVLIVAVEECFHVLLVLSFPVIIL